MRRVSTDAALGIDQVHRLSTDEYHRLIEAGGFGVPFGDLLHATSA